MFFDGWDSVVRVALLATIAYTILVAALRVIGEQALAKMSAFDLIVTVALGSILVSIPMTSDVTVADGVVAIVTILLLQEGTRLLIKRLPKAKNIIRQRPNLVLWDGHLLPETMDKLNVIEEEVRAAVRKGGLGSLEDVQAIVLETDGDWSIVPRSAAGDLSAFADFQDVLSPAHH